MLVQLLVVANGVELVFSAAELVLGVVERMVAATEVVHVVEFCLDAWSVADVDVVAVTFGGAGVAVKCIK